MSEQARTRCSRPANNGSACFCVTRICTGCPPARRPSARWPAPAARAMAPCPRCRDVGSARREGCRPVEVGGAAGMVSAEPARRPRQYPGKRSLPGGGSSSHNAVSEPNVSNAPTTGTGGSDWRWCGLRRLTRLQTYGRLSRIYRRIRSTTSTTPDVPAPALRELAGEAIRCD